MKLTVATLFLAGFSLAMIVIIGRRIKQEQTGIRSALVWLFLWFAIGFFSLFPGLLNLAAEFAQMESRIMFVLLFAVFVLFAFMFSVTNRLDRMQRNIEKIVQEIALLNFKTDGEGDTPGTGTGPGKKSAGDKPPGDKP